MTEASAMNVLVWLVNVFFHGLCGYPVLLLLAFLVMLILWGGAGRGFGLPALFWHEQRLKQLVVGVAVGVLISQIGFVAFLMDNRLISAGTPIDNSFFLSQSDSTVQVKAAPGGRGNHPVIEVTLTESQGQATTTIPMSRLVDTHLHPWISSPPLPFDFLHPDPFEERMAWYPLAWYLVGVWLWLSLAWLIGNVILAVAQRWRNQSTPRRMSANVRLPLWPLLFGLLIAVGATSLFIDLAYWLLQFVPEWPDWSLVTPGLHVLAGVNFLVLFGGYWLLRLDRLGQFVSPAVSICILLGWVAGLYGFVVFWSAQAQLLAPSYVPGIVVSPWFWLMALLLAAVGLNGLTRFKYRFPGLEPFYDPNQQVKLSAYSPDPRTPLLASGQVRWPHDQLRRLATGDKPKLVVVCVSGGGIRAAVWAARVLTRLEEVYPDFPYHVRLVTGASGGMVGASYYVASLNAPDQGGHRRAVHEPEKNVLPLSDIAANLGQDMLSPVVQRLVLSDFPALVLPIPGHRDRGRALEEAFREVTGEVLGETLRSLAAGEEAGWRPSLIFSPMLVEDGRRLLISNLDLAFLTEARGSSLADRDHLLSVSSLEFFKLFPDAGGFRLSTAARMSATFPYISPGVALPTEPRRRVVDAGYYDNYGVDLAASWLYDHSAWLASNTSGVMLIQIRDDWGERMERSVAERRDQSLWGAGLQWLTTPLEGVLAARQAVMSFRNDGQVEVVSHRFEQLAGPGFFNTMTFGLPEEVSLSWYLTDDERQRILSAFDEPSSDDPLKEFRLANRLRLEQVLRWLQSPRS